MPGSGDTDEDRRPPRVVQSHAERLGKQSGNREECEDKHRYHPSGIRLHAFLLHEEFRQITSDYRYDRNYGVKGKDQSLSERTGSLCPELVGKI